MRKRNRGKTEQRILNAALDLIRESGFIDFGVNTISRRAGCDKVLLYRYFSGVEGILKNLATTGKVLEKAGLEASLFPSVHPSGRRAVIEAPRRWVQAVHAEPLLDQLNRWRQVSRNPLTERFRALNEEVWRLFRIEVLHTLPSALKGPVHETLETLNPYSSRAAMSSVPRHLLLAIEVHLDRVLPEWENRQPAPTRPTQKPAPPEQEELPTNLL